MISHNARRALIVATAFAVTPMLLTPTLSAPKAAPTKVKAVKPAIAPDFTLKDVNGVAHKLSDFRGHPVALYFFCGCDWCHKTARDWANVERAHALPPDAKTLVVFQADAAGAKQFAGETALDVNKNIYLPDTADLAVTIGIYNAEPCPRVWVIDRAGNVVYTNNHKDDQPRQNNDEQIIVNHALAALSKAESSKAAG